MRVLITGSSGLIGSALTISLTAAGYTVIRLQRRNFDPDSPLWDPEFEVLDLVQSLEKYAVVHLAGENIAGGRWSEKKKNRILNSRVHGTKLLAEYFAGIENKPQVFISASAVGFYGERGSEILDESCVSGSGFLAKVCVNWEKASKVAAEAGIRVANVRFGVVLSSKGGALKKMLLPFKMGLGGIIGSGKQFMSWVSIDDAVAMIEFIISNDSIHRSVNLVSPNPISNHEFTKTLGCVLQRPTLFPLPAFAARLAFGEMAEELLFSSTRAYPKNLLESGYKFLHPELNKALAHIIEN
ncbi:MAG: TIGR01777 family protein [SAR324 cluster bacterium]|nr:TIGR01777 family protein [SAR324 cluster bacterium]